MDGARISNAAAALGLPFRAFTRDAGVDVLSFGGTKNGMMGGEAIVFFPTLTPSLPQGRSASPVGRGVAEFKFIRKQGLQLASKMRYIAAQFDALLSNERCLRLCRSAQCRRFCSTRSSTSGRSTMTNMSSCVGCAHGTRLKKMLIVLLGRCGAC
jgi:threonine aldolase